MKKQIYWTYKHFEDSSFENHPHYGLHCVIALTPMENGFCYNFTSDGEYIHQSFETKVQAINYIQEINKPIYYEAFGASYELKYLGSETDEWFAIYGKWKSFLLKLSEIRDWANRPWYIKTYEKIKALFIR